MNPEIGSYCLQCVTFLQLRGLKVDDWPSKREDDPGGRGLDIKNYSPVNFPRRFSKTEAIPSPRSLVWKHSTPASV